MISEQAVVIRSDQNWVEIQPQRESICGHCELNKGCGTGALAKLLVNRSRPIRLPNNEQGLNPGDQLTIGLEERGLMLASLLVYGLPLVGMLVAALVVDRFFGGDELVIIATAVVGFIGAYKATNAIANSYLASAMTPKILTVVVNPVVDSRS